MTLLEAFRRTSSPEVMMQSASESVAKYLEADKAGFFEIFDESAEFVSGWTAGRLPLLSGKLPMPEFGSAYEARILCGETIAIGDIGSLPPVAAAEFARIGTRAFIVVPFIRDGAWSACFYISQSSARQWTADETTIVRSVGEQTWSVVERARAEAALAKSEARLKLALEAAGGLATWDWEVPNERFHCNARFAELFSGDPHRPDSTISLEEFQNAIHPEDRARVMARVQVALESNGEYAEEYRVIQRDGNTRWVFAHGRCLREGNSQRFPGVLVDTTERKKAELSLQQSEERLNLALDAGGGVGAWDWDVPDDRVYANARFAELYSIDPERAAGGEKIAAFIDAIHADDRGHVNEQIQGALQSGQDYSSEYRLVQRDGSVRWVLARGRCRLDSNGAPLRFAGVVFDITERKKIEVALAQQATELKRSNEDLEIFAHVASHDLRSPMNTVLAFTELLEKRYRQSEDSEINQFLTIIHESAARMSDLISALLTYSRLSSNDPAEVSPASSLTACDDALANLQTLIEETQAVVKRGELPELMVSPVQLTQVFQNLISNAIHYRGDASPRVHIFAEKQDNFWRFTVADNGQGIAPPYHLSIFEPFKRLHGAERPGSGIGLAFCRKFIQREGGRIWVESAEGKGASFHFTLPAV